MVQPDHRQLGTAAHQGKALAVEVPTATRSRHYPQKSYTIYVTPPGQGPTIEGRRHTQYRRGGFHKAGEGPAFGGSLVTFCPVRKSPQRSVPARLASLNHGWLDGHPPFLCPWNIKNRRGDARSISPAGGYFTRKVLGARRSTRPNMTTEYTAVTTNTSRANQVGVLLTCKAA